MRGEVSIFITSVLSNGCFNCLSITGRRATPLPAVPWAGSSSRPHPKGREEGWRAGGLRARAIFWGWRRRLGAKRRVRARGLQGMEVRCGSSHALSQHHTPDNPQAPRIIPPPVGRVPSRGAPPPPRQPAGPLASSRPLQAACPHAAPRLRALRRAAQPPRRLRCHAWTWPWFQNRRRHTPVSGLKPHPSTRPSTLLDSQTREAYFSLLTSHFPSALP